MWVRWDAAENEMNLNTEKCLDWNSFCSIHSYRALAKDRGGPKMTFQALFYPATDAHFDPPSYMAHHQHYRLPSEGMKWFWNSHARRGSNQ